MCMCICFSVFCLSDANDSTEKFNKRLLQNSKDQNTSKMYVNMATVVEGDQKAPF